MAAWKLFSVLNVSFSPTQSVDNVEPCVFRDLIQYPVCWMELQDSNVHAGTETKGTQAVAPGRYQANVMCVSFDFVTGSATCRKRCNNI